MVHFPSGEMRARNGDRVSFPRWGKRNVVSHHFTELVLEITVLEMRQIHNGKSALGIKNIKIEYPLSNGHSLIVMKK